LERRGRISKKFNLHICELLIRGGGTDRELQRRGGRVGAERKRGVTPYRCSLRSPTTGRGHKKFEMKRD